MGRQPRQRPISCHLCRVRKLRCSRQFPCSNCTSRGVVCQHEGVAAAPTAVAPSQPTNKASSSLKDLSAFELLSRLERLEGLVAAQSKEQSVKRQAYPEPSQASPVSRPVPPRLQRLTADALQLERSCSDQKLTGSLLSDPIVFRTCPIRLICNQPSFVVQNRAASTSPGQIDAIKCIWLPRRDEIRIIVQKYISDISYFHHIIHVPTIQSLVEDIYTNLEQNVPVDIGGILLLVCICASTTYAWTPQDDVRCLFANVAEANSQSTFWIKQALDVSDHAQRTAYASIECVQGLIILFFVFCNHESVSQRARNCIMSAISIASELSLHRIDEPPNMLTPAIARMSEAKKEMGRRIWWYLVAMDWMLAQFNNPQEGFYVIHPSQMAVNKPRNVKDEDLIDGLDVIDRPMSEPTCVSYFLQRIRLAELCQLLLEQSPLYASTTEPEAYTNVLEADTKLNEFIRGIPDFLSLDNSSLSHLPMTDPRRSPLITVQRYTLNLLLHRQLCKIHLPYLAQGTVDPAYAYSRDVCLRSARVVIELDHELSKEHLPFCTSRLRMTMVLRSVFLASIALVLNACLKGDSTDSVEGDEEVAGAWRILQEAQGQSPTATRLLELSIQLLRKYKIKHRALDLLQQQISEVMSPTLPMTPESAHPDQRIGPITQTTGFAREPDTALLEQQWQLLEGRMDLNTVDWDKLFWGLDAPFI
ncbi:putative transcription factor lepB [Cladobotryum mycophilum]|uniref:Transcription factor lepB n=1 Tax=Cladobotryum mycophilum TaxID=491253 RepID=A0ABR0S950_9HYPO